MLMNNREKLLNCNDSTIGAIVEAVKEMKDYSNAEDALECIERMTVYEILDTYLQYEGIIGYTSTICDLMLELLTGIEGCTK